MGVDNFLLLSSGNVLNLIPKVQQIKVCASKGEHMLPYVREKMSISLTDYVQNMGVFNQQEEVSN